MTNLEMLNILREDFDNMLTIHDYEKRMTSLRYILEIPELAIMIKENPNLANEEYQGKAKLRY